MNRKRCAGRSNPLRGGGPECPVRQLVLPERVIRWAVGGKVIDIGRLRRGKDPDEET